jgi:hypothetical protein
MRLVTLEPAEAEPALADRAGNEVWRDAAGAVCAVSYREDGDPRLYVPNVGTFRFTSGSEVIEAQPLPSTSVDLLDDAFHRVALPLGLQWQGVQALHASAVTSSRGVVGFCGPAGAGKSTIAFALHRAGHPICADDALGLRRHGDAFGAVPVPFRIRLRRPSAEWFDEPGLLKSRNGGNGWMHAPGNPLAALYLLRRRSDAADPAPVKTERLPAADAFRELLPHAYYLTLDDRQSNRQLVEFYLELAERVAVFRLAYTPGLADLDAMVRRVVTEVTQL